MAIHEWFDQSKAHHGDFRHRALRHHAEGIFLMETIFGPTLKLSICKHCGHAECRPAPLGTSGCDAEGCECKRHCKKTVPTRWVGEQHVTEDLGFIPAATEWLSAIKAEPWMARSRKLSREEGIA